MIFRFPPKHQLFTIFDIWIETSAIGEVIQQVLRGRHLNPKMTL